VTLTNPSAIQQYCDSVINNFGQLIYQSESIAAAADMSIGALTAGGKIIFCGNGGSAADSQHLAAELMGRYKRDRDPLPAMALTVDTSALTAIANDYHYDQVFSRQLGGIGRAGDILIALSTSGDSANVLYALEKAREIGISSIGLTGNTGGEMKSICDICICAPSAETNHIQEMHIAIGHMICGIIEDRIC